MACKDTLPQDDYGMRKFETADAEVAATRIATQQETQRSDESCYNRRLLGLPPLASGGQICRLVAD